MELFCVPFPLLTVGQALDRRCLRLTYRPGPVLVLCLWRQLDNEQGLICPITTTFFEDPVKSRVCNHVYSRMAIEALIKRNRRNEVQVCPVVGGYSSLGLGRQVPVQG